MKIAAALYFCGLFMLGVGVGLQAQQALSTMLAIWGAGLLPSAVIYIIAKDF